MKEIIDFLNFVYSFVYFLEKLIRTGIGLTKLELYIINSSGHVALTSSSWITEVNEHWDMPILEREYGWILWALLAWIESPPHPPGRHTWDISYHLCRDQESNSRQ